jgi:hypothetical protein
MGYGDLFAAAVFGGMLARRGVFQVRAAILTAGLALTFDLLFFAVHELPATVPVALALLALRDRHAPAATTRARATAPLDRVHASPGARR